jgi:glucose dehydrogenase
MYRMGIGCVALAAMSLAGALTSSVVKAANAVDGQWPVYGGNQAFQRYSPLDQITKDNLASLEIAWIKHSVDASLTQKFPDVNPSPYNKGTPIMIGGVLYVSDSVGLVEAIDAETGKTQWIQKPLPATLKEVAGESTRGVAYWQSGSDKRIFSQRGQFLYALDAETGAPIPGFGDGGKVFVRWPTNENVTYSTSSGPAICKDVIIIGGVGGSHEGGWGGGDDGLLKEAYPENVRGYDARTGHLLWTFHIIPDEGQVGHESWGKDSWRFSGNMGAWAPLSVDEELGYVYVPLTAPTISYYGGHRPGDNKWSDSLVALDVRTGKLAWAQQLVHHDLWDYDTASPPVLGDVTIRGQTVKVVMQGNKPGMLFVFDRRTGVPVWPVEERPVPQSTIPGEHTSPTQPFSVQFPPLNQQGITDGDLADFTPDIKKEARELVSHYVTGPIFTPPSLPDPAPGGKKGTLEAPGVWGSANWNNGAFDPDTAVYYSVTRNRADVYVLYKPADRAATLDYTVYDIDKAKNAAGEDTPQPGLPKPIFLKSGLPIFKPPYGRLSAYSISEGRRLWVAANGDSPEFRSNPALKGVKLPALLGNLGRAAPLVTKTVLFLADGSDAIYGDEQGLHGPVKLRAYDKASGKVLWDFALPAGATGAPMTYMVGGKQYIVVPVGNADYGGAWIALRLKP